MNPISLSVRLLEDLQETVSVDSVIAVVTDRWISANCWQKTLATVENYFSLIFGVLVGNTKLTIVM